MNVLSLFDGISCGYLALQRAGIKIDNYYASEIDKYAIQISENNFPGIIRLGDINNFCRDCIGSKYWHNSGQVGRSIDNIDLIIGGSPCQGFSFAGKQLAFVDPRSVLFWKFVEIVNYYKPKYFLLENVRMKQEHQDVISEALGVEPVVINSALVSAQNRVRYYWTNIPNVTQPEDRHVRPEDIICGDGHAASSSKDIRGCRVVTIKDKFNCLVANYYKGIRPNSRPGVLIDRYLQGLPFDQLTKQEFRMLTPIECERLQTLPDNYTAGISNTQRYKALGNAWTVDVIAHIFKGIKHESGK